MDTLLAALVAYLRPIFTASPYLFKHVVQYRRRDITNLIQQNSVPILVVEGARDYSSNGPMGGQRMRNYVVNIRGLRGVTNPAKLQDVDNPASMNNTMEAVRKTLAQNKSLGTENDTFRYQTDEIGEVTENDTGSYVESVLRCQFSRAEQWDGPLNDQPDLVPVTS